MESAKLEIEIWNGKCDFSLKSQKMKDILLQRRCAKALYETGGEKIVDSKKAEQT